MNHIYTPYIWLFIGTIIMNLLMFFYVSKNRHRNGVAAFCVALLFSSLWCVGTMMQISEVGMEPKLFWSKVMFPAYTFGPLAWMIMVLQITDQLEWTSMKRVLLLCIIPVITVILVWTNDFHGLIWQQVSLDDQGELVLKYGMWFWVHAVYSDGLNFFSVIFTIRFWRSKAPLFGKQYKYLAFSMIFIMLVNLTYVLRIGPDIDMTSVAWGVSSLFITWALFRSRLFDIVPIARNRVMESITAGIVVLDLMNRIVDMNPSACRSFNCEAPKIIGCSALKFFERWPALRNLVLEGGEYTEVKYIQDKEYLYYETSCLPIKNERENILGKLLIIRDITDKKIAENKLLQKQQEIAVKDERERMARDLHDNLAQILGFINIQAQAIREYLKQGQLQTAVGCLERLTEVAQDAHNTVRKTILAMHGGIGIEEKKVSDFLERQAILLKKRYNIAAEIDYKGAESLELYDPEVTAQILNIIKESINNIIKHSGASLVKLMFEDNGEWLVIYVVDDGYGFEPDSIVPNEANKYGLLFIKERASEIGGHIDIYSEVGKGTTIKIQVPKTHRTAM